MQLVRHRKRVLKEAQAKLAQVQQEYEQLVGRHEQRFRAAKQRLQQIKANLDSLKAQQAEAIRQLHGDAQKKQREEHLSGAFICHAEIAGIGPGRVTLLESYGIETALDVSENEILNIKGFGPKLTAALLEWRSERERSFRFDPAKGVPQADLQAIQVLYYQQRVQLERTFRRGPAELQQLTQLAKREAEGISQSIPQLELDLAHATADVMVLR